MFGAMRKYSHSNARERVNMVQVRKTLRVESVKMRIEKGALEKIGYV